MPGFPTYRKLIATELTPDFRKASTIIEVPVPEPGPGEVVVKNRIAAVNATDVNITAGRYSGTLSLPMDLGIEAAGEVVAVGRAVRNLKEGDAVATSNLGGGYREYNVVNARYAVPIPKPSPEALSVVVSGLTASIALHVTGQMGTEETVLVTAAAGGTGQYAVQLAHLAGNHVIGTCGTPEKMAMLRDLGCDRVVNYHEEDVREVLRGTYPDGIDLVYEGVGGKLFDTCVEALARHGRLLSIGYVSEYVEGPEKIQQRRIYTKLISRSASIRGFFLPHFAAHYREHTARLFSLLDAGTLRVAIDPTVFHGLDAVPDAVEYLHSGQSIGKVVVWL